MLKRILMIAGVAGALALAAGSARAQAAAGKPLYLKNCRSCHGTTGTPTKQARREYPKIATLDPEFLATRSQDSIVTVITNGAGKDMKPFKAKLTKEEIETIALYVKTVLGAPKQ